MSRPDVRRVRVRLADEAWISIYPDHAPLIAETMSGPLVFDTAEGREEMELAAGILRVHRNNRVGILTTAPLATAEGAPAVEGERASGVEEARFDRLARQLVITLSSGTSGVGLDEDEAP